ncbi:MAG: hypothetical protein H0Z39_10550 [Peptococcaceae bacterium]|nr:hypothetical protein [Peptococcaceae bacterium]
MIGSVKPADIVKKYGGLLALFAEVSGMLDPLQGDWKWVCWADDVASRPRVFTFARDGPIFVIRTGETYRAYRADCPGDGTFVEWDDDRQGFYCPSCGTFFNKVDGTDENGTKTLQTWPCRVQEGAVYLLRS